MPAKSLPPESYLVLAACGAMFGLLVYARSPGKAALLLILIALGLLDTPFLAKLSFGRRVAAAAVIGLCVLGFGQLAWVDPEAAIAIAILVMASVLVREWFARRRTAHRAGK